MHKLFHEWRADLALRLHECARLVGDKGGFAKRSHMSLAQLYRYLNGTQTPQVKRLFQMAQASGVSPLWLLSGDNKKQLPQDMCSLQTLREVYLVFEQAYLEYGETFSHAQKADMLPLLIFAAELEKQQGAQPGLFERKIMLEAFYFLQPLLQGRRLEGYLRGMQHMQRPHGDKLELQRFAAMVAEANTALFSSKVGEIYYARMGLDFPESRLQLLHHLRQQVVQALGVYRDIRMLDLGCGNGRHLLYWAKYLNEASAFVGIDGSAFAVQEAIKNTQAHHRIKIYQRDVCDTRLAGGYYNFINCMSVVNFMPYIPNAGVGAEALFAEAYRLLQPGGVMHITARTGQVVEFIPFEQPYTQAQLLQMAQQQGFKVLHMRQEDLSTTSEFCVPHKYRHLNIMLLQK